MCLYTDSKSLHKILFPDSVSVYNIILTHIRKIVKWIALLDRLPLEYTCYNISTDIFVLLDYWIYVRFGLTNMDGWPPNIFYTYTVVSNNVL